ncbi:MAG: dTDP-glucose 4,6-dehydratase [Candidatus Kapaibacterium sp.]
MEKILVTGGCGFIGSNFIKKLISHEGFMIVNLDALTYAGNPENLSDIENSANYKFIRGSISDRKLIDSIFSEYEFDGIVNFAAESHVDRSILDSTPFLETNINGTLVLLEAARKYKSKKYLQVSTDEVYGSLGAKGKFTEITPLQPNSPYSASKASADLLVRSFNKTYGLPAIITRCSNNYGPYQFPEKLIPLMIINALENKPLPVYGDGRNVRDWIHVADHCDALQTVYTKGKPGEVYNIGGNCEKENIEIVKSILNILGKPESLIEYVKDRPGHDRRYAIDCTKIESGLGWKPAMPFREGLEQTINWYIENQPLWQNIRNGSYRDYYKTQYGKAL